jgi:hypothetical protein
LKFRLSEHAEEELERRRIPRHLLDSVLEHPQQIVPTERGKAAYQSRLDFGGGKIFLLRAIVAADTDPATVVTVYRTSKIGKYWRTP